MAISGTGRILRLRREWGFQPGDIIKFSAYPISKPKDVVNVYKKVCAMNGGESVGIYVDRSWGFEDGELIVFSVTPTDKIFS